MELTGDPGDSLSQQCSNCDSTSAACWCLDCNEALCSICVLAHRRVTVTRSHRLLHHPPEGIILSSPTKFCSLHPSEPLKLICFTCKQLTCRDCQLMSHMNHRYQFVSETVVSLKKQLDVYTHSIKRQEDTVRQSLQDMETRLQLIEQTESHLRTLLQEGFIKLAKLLKANMMTLHKDMQKVYELECEQIQGRMVKLKQLLQRQSSLKENLEKARALPDLPSLLTHVVQIKSEMKALLDQDSNPPLKMPEVKLITETDCQETFSELCKLHVTWVPFSVLPTSDKNTGTPPTSTCNRISSTVMDSTSGSPSLNPMLTSSSALCSLAASKSRRDSTSPNSTSTCLISFSPQTETASCNASPVSSDCVATPSPSQSSNLFSAFNKFSSNLTLYNLLTKEHVETHHQVNPRSPSTNSQSGQLSHARPPTSTSSTPSGGPLHPSCSSSGTPASRSSPLCTPSHQHFPTSRSSSSSSSSTSITSPAHTSTFPLPSDPITQTGKTWNCTTPVAIGAVPSQSTSLSDWSSILPSSTTSRLPHPSAIPHSISTHPVPTGLIKTGTTSDIPTPVTINSFSSKSACLSSQLSLPLSSTSSTPSPSGPVFTGSIAQTGSSSDISTPVTINSFSSPSAHLTNQLSLPPSSVSSVSPYSSVSTTLSTSTRPAASTRPLFQTLNTSVTNMVVPDSSKSHSSVLLVSCNQSNLPLSSSICPSSVAPPTISSTCLPPFSKPLPKTSDTRKAGAPVQMNSFSTSLHASPNQFKPLLTHSAMVLACSTTSSTTPPKFISTCAVSSCTPFPQAGNSNNTTLLVPVNTSSSTSEPATSFFVNYPTNPPVSTFSGLTNTASLVPVRIPSSLWNSSSTSSSIAFTHNSSATPLTSTCSPMTHSSLLHTAYSLVPVNHLSTSQIFANTASGSGSSSPPYWFLPQTNASRASIVQCLSMLPPGSTFPLSPSQSLPTLQPVQPLQVLNQTVVPHQNQPTIVMLTNTQSTYQVLLNETAVFKLPDNHASHLATMQKQSSLMESTIAEVSPETSSSSDGPSSTLSSNQQTLEDKSPAVPSSPVSSLQKLDSDSALYSSSSSCEQNQQIPVVDSVVDSRWDNSTQQLEKAQENKETKHNAVISEETNVTPFLSEETELEDNPAALETSEREEVSAVIEQQDFSLSQWQPKVSVFRLPLSLPTSGKPLPSFRLLPGESEDEIYLEEMSEDSQSDADDVPSDKEDFKKPLSSPDSPVTLEILSCSVCASPGTSIICSACGRGYHRGCHVPPVGPDFWSEWICSLCQDLSDPSDPYSSERFKSTSLSLQNQRRCESLVLYLKVEVCSRCSEFGGLPFLKVISDRLTLRRPPPYQTAAQLVSDMWALFNDASQDHELNKLQESFQKKLVETLSSVLHPSLLNAPTANPQPADGSRHSREDELEISKAEEEEEVIPASKLKDFRKRLRDFLHLNGSPGAKRAKRSDQ